jgi:hypothetical protein
VASNKHKIKIDLVINLPIFSSYAFWVIFIQFDYPNRLQIYLMMQI